MFMLESFAKNLYCSKLYIRKYCQEIVNTIPYNILAEWLLLSDLLFKIFSALWFLFQFSFELKEVNFGRMPA